MRRAVTPTIPPSLYRHFAVVTVVLTAGLAMFAEGENREAQAASVARTAQDSPPAPATITRASPASASPQAPSWWEVGDSEIEPEVSAVSQFGEERDLEREAVSEYPPEYLESLNERERGVLLAGLRESGSASPIAPPGRRGGSVLQGE